MRKSLSEILESDARSPIVDSDLDDAVWLALTEKIAVPSDLKSFAPPVAVYFASRFLQWEVDNGGFAQAAFNIPEWFGLAAEGYRALGKPAAAKIIVEVSQLLTGNEESLNRLRNGEIEWEDHFGDHDFSVFDDLVHECGEWEIDGERIAYVRINREAFKM